ncbi:MAG: 1,4-dihydroxy-2-naphthoate octaprenyltransferase [Rhodospirillales bacterium]|nr:1,4-dihydroxy-2-naphthoate octaprenyltransferase [Rhodospirillales bacterium]
MIQVKPHPFEPTPERLGGTSLRAQAWRAFLATRPRFLGASLLPLLVGTAWALSRGLPLDPSILLLALLAAGLVHSGANVLNDVADARSGTDPANRQRLYPYTGGSRFIQNRVMSEEAMARLGWTLLALSLVPGLTLVALKGWMVLGLGAIGLALGLAYSLPPLWLSGRGLGEVAVALAFGVLPVLGGAWLQGAPLDGRLVLFALPPALWAAAILLINSVPDVEADALAGRLTLAVRLGPVRTARLYRGLIVAAALAVLAQALAGGLAPWAPLAPLLLLPLVARSGRAIATRDGAALRPAIRATLAHHAIGCVTLAFAAATGEESLTFLVFLLL